MTFKIFACFVLLKAGTATIAQAQDYYGPWRFEEGSTQTVFSDTAFVRSSVGGAIIDTLFSFGKITIHKHLPNTLEIGQKNAPWYGMKYKKGENMVDGYVWGGALAIKSASKDGITFLFTKLSYPQAATNEQDNWPKGSVYTTCAIKSKGALANVEQCFYNISRESANFLDSYQEDDGNVYNPRFEKAGPVPAGAKFLVSFCMSGEACGIPTYFIKAAWDGEHLIRMPLLESVGDGGIFGYDEAYVYTPQRKNELTIRGKTITYKEVGDEYLVDETTFSNALVKWDACKRTFIYRKNQD